MIGAISTTLNEADIVESTVRHLLAHGIDFVLIADGRSTDGTRDVLQDLKETTTGRVEWFDDGDDYHAQEKWMNQLAATAAERGAEWIIPFDADEFWYPTDVVTIAELIGSLSPAVNVLDAQLWHHRDFEHKYSEPERLPKVAYRWSPDAVLAMGQHSVSVPNRCSLEGRLQIRHLQYRGADHFVHKIRERAPRVGVVERSRGNGSHITSLESLTDAELRAHYAAMTAGDVIHDPVPLRSNAVPLSWGPGDDLA